MASFTETSLALAEWNASTPQLLGVHGSQRLIAGAPGLVVSDELFDPVLHVGLQPNYTSSLGIATGEDRIDVVRPEHPLHMNIIVHNDPQSEAVPEFLRPMAGLKRALSFALRESIDEAHIGMSDRTEVYLVGTPDPEDYNDPTVDIIDDTEDPETASRVVADICMTGLTFVVGDFLRLGLITTDGGKFQDVVAVKANHPSELRIPAGVGNINAGAGRAVRTNKPKELAEANARLADLDKKRVQRLEAAGISVAQIIFDYNYESGLKTEVADEAVANAIQGIIGH